MAGFLVTEMLKDITTYQNILFWMASEREIIQLFQAFNHGHFAVIAGVSVSRFRAAYKQNLHPRVRTSSNVRKRLKFDKVICKIKKC